MPEKQKCLINHTYFSDNLNWDIIQGLQKHTHKKILLRHPNWALGLYPTGILLWHWITFIRKKGRKKSLASQGDNGRQWKND